MNLRKTLAGGVVAISILCLATSSISFAQTTWVGTATQAIPLANATSLGALSASTPLHIGVALQIQNRSQLMQLVQEENNPASSLYGSSLSTAQFMSVYAPTAAQVSAVASYLSAQGFTNIIPDDNNLIVQADGTAAIVNAAFNTRLDEFTQTGVTVFANTLPAQVPSSLSGKVVAVLGLSNAGQVRPSFASQATSSPNSSVSAPSYPASYYPQQYESAYNAGTIPTGSKTAVAVFAEGDVSSVLSDFKVARTAEKVTVTPITVVYAGLQSTDTSGVPEWDIDTQSSAGIAGTVSKIYLYVATSLTDSDVVYAFNKFASQNLARAGNASFGLCEVYPYLDGTMIAADNIFLEAAAQGQTVFASTGDTGGNCPAEGVGENGVPAGAPMVNWPAASPYVVGVGGTTLLTNSDGTYDAEISWYSGGGGISQFEYSPYWQTAAVPSAKDNARGLPDIAMVADPYSGENVYMSCQPPTVPTESCTAGWGAWGGTSLASPLAMGVWARLLSAHSKLGFASPHLYNGAALLTTTTALGFNDVIVGEDNPWAATPGWDYTTGLGTFDVSAINTVIK